MLEDYYATLKKRQLSEMLAKINVDKTGGVDDTAIVLCAGELSPRRLKYWQSRLTFYCNAHLREYRVRYVKEKNLTVIACTRGAIRRNGREIGANAVWYVGVRGATYREEV